VKWFQLDSDMPDDPKIRAVARAFGAEGIGGLVCLWCHVAKHGRDPGHAIDSAGMPLPLEDLHDASRLEAAKFTALIDLCTRTGHFRRDTWERSGGIWIPAMARRGDTYQKRRVRDQQGQLDLA